MFDKKKFKKMLEKALGKRTISQYASESSVNRTYLSKYLNERLDSPPHPDIIRRLAENACNGVTYHDLMIAAGYIIHEENNNNNPNTPVLTRRDEREIEKILEKTRKQLENAEGLMFDGKPASPEAIQSILDSMRIGMEIAKQRNKEKYTPKKYINKQSKKDEDKQ